MNFRKITNSMASFFLGNSIAIIILGILFSNYKISIPHKIDKIGLYIHITYIVISLIVIFLIILIKKAVQKKITSKSFLLLGFLVCIARPFVPIGSYQNTEFSKDFKIFEFESIPIGMTKNEVFAIMKGGIQYSSSGEDAIFFSLDEAICRNVWHYSRPKKNNSPYWATYFYFNEENRLERKFFGIK